MGRHASKTPNEVDGRRGFHLLGLVGQLNCSFAGFFADSPAEKGHGDRVSPFRALVVGPPAGWVGFQLSQPLLKKPRGL
jgi:hypothetical protein